MTVPRILITAGPTHEAIDSVRFIGNRSSGRMGVALARAAAERGWAVTLLLGPATVDPAEAGPGVRVERFVSCADLQGLLTALWPSGAEVLVMAAAVADYRPVRAAKAGTKLRRSGERLVLELESTPDLVEECCRRKPSGSLVVGFALEPATGLREAAIRKLTRKGLDGIVANPLETMDSATAEGELIWGDGSSERLGGGGGATSKVEFARALMERIAGRLAG